MDSWPPRVAALMERVLAWASSDPMVKGLALVGSWARGRDRPDSDVDLMILTDEGPALVADARWLDLFGTVRQTEVESWGPVRSIRTWYHDGLEVEFALAPPDWATLPLDPGTERVILDGLVILCDPLGLLAKALDSIERTGLEGT